MTARRLAVYAVIACLAPACGAKTGLDTPDAQVDATVAPDAPLPIMRCIEVPPGSDTVTASFTLPVSLAVVDVFFLIDASASMTDEIDNVRNRLADLVVPAVTDAIPDAAFGLGYTGEFPVEPHGPDDVRPYELRATITDDVPRLEAELARVPTWGNFDDPESQVEGLYQIATGEGLDPWIPPFAGCPRGGLGGVCFRADSLPVVMVITDAPFHNGPRGVEPVEDYDFEGPHTYEAAVDALSALEVRTIGLGASDPRRPSPIGHLRALARDTGSVDAAGDALAFDIGSTGDGVGPGIVDAIRQLAEGLPLDVDAMTQDLPGDALDARTIVRAIRPAFAEPPDGVRTIGATAFLGVVPGTRVTFDVEIDVSALPPSDSTRRIPARIIFRAFGRTRLGSEDVVIVVPGLDGGGCESEGS